MGFSSRVPVFSPSDNQMPGVNMNTVNVVRHILLVSLLLPFAARAASVTLSPSTASPAKLGTVVTFTANTDGDAPWSYRFRTRRVVPPLAGEDSEVGYRTVVDFGPQSTLNWTTIVGEGAYQVEVAARNNATGDV